MTARRSTATRCTEITDQFGVRVVTYLHGDVAAVAGCSPTSSASSTTATSAARRPGRAGSAIQRHLLVAPDPTKGLPRHTSR